MAADLHIHVMRGVTEADIALFFQDTLGSKHFKPELLFRQRSLNEMDREFTKMHDTPNIWIGEVSWLKAAVFNDPDAFIPNVVLMVHEAIGEDLPVLDEVLLEKLRSAFDAVGGGSGYSIAEWPKVEEFLRQHMGERLFTISW